MTGVIAAAMAGSTAGGGSINPAFDPWDLIGVSLGSNLAYGSLSLFSDGTANGTYGNSDGGVILGSAFWFTPTTVGIGTSYWVRYTVTSGSATVNGASTWTQLNATRTITKAGITGLAACVFTIEIASDSGGSTIVMTSPSNVVEFAHA